MKKYLSKINNLETIEFEVTQNNHTEKPFDNKYWDNKKEGIYVDIVSCEPLFSSRDKYESGSGWPSFTKSINNKSIILNEDFSDGLTRIEVASDVCHLGHLFKDGPKDQGGLRYCINSASLKFIPKEELIIEGYGEYLSLFSDEFKTSSENSPSEDGSSDSFFEYAYLAGGCFWGLENLLSKADGVVATQVGYCGGALTNPTYEEVSLGDTGHAETVEVKYNTKETTYREILKLFFKIHDPTTINQQGNDKGTNYRSVIFYKNDIQKYAAINIINLANESDIFKSPIVTQLELYENFYKAEEYHQKYLERYPSGYNCHFVRHNWEF